MDWTYLSHPQTCLLGQLAGPVLHNQDKNVAHIESKVRLQRDQFNFISILTTISPREAEKWALLYGVTVQTWEHNTLFCVYEVSSCGRKDAAVKMQDRGLHEIVLTQLCFVWYSVSSSWNKFPEFKPLSHILFQLLKYPRTNFLVPLYKR